MIIIFLVLKLHEFRRFLKFHQCDALRQSNKLLFLHNLWFFFFLWAFSFVLLIFLYPLLLLSVFLYPFVPPLPPLLPYQNNRSNSANFRVAEFHRQIWYHRNSIFWLTAFVSFSNNYPMFLLINPLTIKFNKKNNRIQ